MVMRHVLRRPLIAWGIVAVCCAAPRPLSAQDRPVPVAPGRAVVSPEVGTDRRVTFRILAADAQKVELRSPGDIPGVGGRGVAPPQLTKERRRRVGSAPFGPAARRRLSLRRSPSMALAVVDARNPMTSQTNTTVYSLAVVPGSDVFDTKNVPHGAVASVSLQLDARSAASGGCMSTRRPDTKPNRDRYPVFYLLHGAGDVDESWTSVGRAGFILDNLIAAGKAKPMIVVMPAGHVNGAGAALGGPVPAAAVRRTCRASARGRIRSPTTS